jgi:tRNA threonylcarbamoyl adenosine modification protein YjeE
MSSTATNDYSFTVALENEQATRQLVTDVAGLIEPGDVITLSGDLGAGKTTFARAFIRHFAGDETLEVPSPSFTLMQTYALPGLDLVHADLYRLSDPSELAELGLDEANGKAVMLVEWPDRAAKELPPDRLDIAFTFSAQHGPTFRLARVTGCGSARAKAERMAAIGRFLDRHGFGDAVRRRIQGDASSRSYERLTREGRSFILMNAPKRPDGPPVRHGKPYSAIAHLAEDITPFIALARGLSERGFSAPRIIAADRKIGLLVLEDLGNELIVSGKPPTPIKARYEAATGLLAVLHEKSLPDVLPVEPGLEYKLPRYDLDALLIEVELLLDWYLPKLGISPSNHVRTSYINHWRNALLPTMNTHQTWVLRDFHSPNLLWLPDREGVARIGLLDFQDAVMGSAAYDLASLLHDARVDVPETMEIDLLSHYIRIRLQSDASFDAPAFAYAFATFAAQRASKILGIFARLDQRDGKPQYLRHLPRVRTYLQRALKHPALAELAAWYHVNVPLLIS